MVVHELTAFGRLLYAPASEMTDNFIRDAAQEMQLERDRNERQAAEAAIDALGDTRFVLEVAAAKSRVGEAAGLVAEQVHQIHGAMGFTQEHRLHHYTKRLWAWRDEWGNEFYWQSLLGQDISKLGADSVWSFIATSS